MVRHTPSVADYRATSPEDGGGEFARQFPLPRLRGRCQRLTLTEGSWAPVLLLLMTPPPPITGAPPRAMRREEKDHMR